MSVSQRPTNPTIQQIREVTQPVEILSRANSEHWLNDVYLRSVSPYFTKIFIKANMSPNAVTVIMIGIGKIAALSLLISGLPGALLAAALAQFQMVIDCSDGEVARWQEKYSPAGIFLDKVAHYTVEALVPVALGIRAAGGMSVFSSHVMTWWPWLGACLAVLVLLNKALNDAVHIARAQTGREKLEDVKTLREPTHGLLALLRSMTKFFPFQRIFHSIEMTMLIAVAAIVDAATGSLAWTQHLLVAMCVLAAVTVVGHFLAIMSSSRLK